MSGGPSAQGSAPLAGPARPGWRFWWRQRIGEATLVLLGLAALLVWAWPHEGTLVLQVDGLTSCGEGRTLATPVVAELLAGGERLASSSHGGASFGEAYLSLLFYRHDVRGGWARLRIGACPSWREDPHASLRCDEPTWRIERWVFLRPRGLKRPQRVRVTSADWPCHDNTGGQNEAVE